MNNLKEFTGLYSLSKTLRFELKPIGKTLENIEKKHLLEQDEQRANNYKKVKEIIDRYHKFFIETSLINIQLQYGDNGNEDSLCEYFLYYMSNNDGRSEKLEKISENLRRQIVRAFSNNELYKRIFSKELIREDLYTIATPDERPLLQEFREFTTYFSGFHENRRNMYSSDAKSTAISYRLINVNLPKFIDNINTFEKVSTTGVKDKFEKLYQDFESYLNIATISEMFRLDYYTKLLTQTQIDVYNNILGGMTLEDGTKIQGLNEYINLYNQQQRDKHDRLPILKPLYKQILSDRNAISWIPNEFKTDNEVLENIEKCYRDLMERVLEPTKLPRLITNLDDYNLDKIYLCNDTQLTDVSQHMFGSYTVILKAIKNHYSTLNPRKNKESLEKYEERIKKLMKAESYSIGFINRCLKETGIDNNVQSYFSSVGRFGDDSNLISEIVNRYSEICDILNSDYPTGKNLSQDKLNVEKIKNLLDSIKALQHFVKPLTGKGTESEKDEKFYGEFSVFIQELDNINTLYNLVRNYMTRKPYSVEKIKLNFENSTLLYGWDENKETANASIILRKNGDYYLGIFNKDYRKLLGTPMPSDGDCYDKVVYKFFKDITTMVPKCTTQKKDVVAHFAQSSENYSLKDSKTFNDSVTITKEIFDLNNVLYNGVKKFQIEYLRSTGDHSGYENAVTTWKSFCMQFLKAYKSTSIYDLSLIEQQINNYHDLSSFYNSVNLLLYNLSYKPVSVAYINQLVDEGKLYLFRIWNKDFSEFSKGTPNLHTLYWKMLFDERNLADVIYKLNGQAEVFYRKRSISWKDEVMQHGHHYKELKDKFTYPIIKDRRYTMDKFQFHVPITINFKATGQDNINQLTNEYIRESKNLHIIGIDRGERHLLYLTVIDLEGHIKEQYTLNEIVNKYNGNIYSTNYHTLLDQREKERDDARRSWQTIENIKNLKQGYLSQVVHKISQLMIKYNAIVVLEDLNTGFMRGRQKVEKSVYQQFEKMLIDKLNYLVDKKTDPDKPGGLLHAYQLTSKFESFQKMGKQSGMLFYVPAWNTSKMDPVTGFVNLFDTRYENIDRAKDFFHKFDSIYFNKDYQWYEFSFDYNNFTSKAEGTRTKWTVCTRGERIVTFRNPDKNNEWDNCTINLTASFSKLFSDYGIDQNTDLKGQIANQSQKDFFETMLNLFRTTLQMRNSVTGTDIDYLVSPVADKNGNYYDSRNCDSTLPANADANGAYNIARKGLWVVKQIQQYQGDDWKKLKLAISNREWLKFAQDSSAGK